MMLGHVVLGELRGGTSLPGAPLPGRPGLVTVASPSRGVTLRAGSALEALASVGRGSVASAAIEIDDSSVIVRRIRGTRQAVVELSPASPWSIRVQGPTWNTTLLLADLDLRELKLDGAATRVDCYLPRPRGVVPIEISGGAAAIRLHRPPGSHAVARVSSGALQVRLDAFSTRAALLDSRWQSADTVPDDRFELKISGGAVQVSFDTETAPNAERRPNAGPAREPMASRASGAALELLLDGIEKRRG